VGPRRFAILIAALVSLAAPAAAEAGTLSRDGNTIVFTDVAADAVNMVAVYKIDGSDSIFIGDSNTTLSDSGSGCQDEGADTFSCSNVAAVRIALGGASDELHADGGVGDAPPDVPIAVDGGEGNDNMHTGPLNDDLRGGPGTDNLTANAGNDMLDGGFDADYLEGGADGDLVSYAARTEPIGIDFGAPGLLPQPHGSSNDGPENARDHIRTVETVVGGSGNDVMKGGGEPVTLRGGAGDDDLTGSPGAETLDGGAGADTLDPLGGWDTVLAGAGVDSVEARDGAADTVDCGPDSDTAAVDAIDAVTSCGADPGPPGAPPPRIITRTVTLPSRVFLDLAYTFAATRRVTVLRNLFADVEPGARLTASCRTRRGGRCKRTRDLSRAGAAASVRLRSFEGRRLPVGAKLTIRVTKDGMIGAVKTLTVRRRKSPSVRTLCVPPGASGPSAC
jgi:RTX calcium-binding nonapeptide repeat (4 copies)